MRYKGKVYRPPSEAYSLIVQVTYGCSHNTCAFCDMYDDKHFAMRPMNEIREDFEMARQLYRHVERVFLADGDALMRKTDDLVQILGLIYGLFPECQRVTCYASPASLQVKSEDDLRLLRERGLQMVYMGLESGCDAVLERMRKGHSAAAIVAAGQKARRCGMALSVTAISGLGSVELWRHGGGPQRHETGVYRPSDPDGGTGYAAGAVGAGRRVHPPQPRGGAEGDGAVPAAHRLRGQRVPHEPRQQLPDPEGYAEPRPSGAAGQGAVGPVRRGTEAGVPTGAVKSAA